VSSGSILIQAVTSGVPPFAAIGVSPGAAREESGRTLAARPAAAALIPNVNVRLVGFTSTRLKEALSVKVKVKTVGAGELDHLTGLSTTSKIKRLIDKREKIST
jgi:hypothetical protein